MKKLLILLIGLLLISSASAIYDAGVYERGKLIDIKLPCSFNGTICNTTVICNVTATYPNTSFILDNVIMTNTGNGMPNATLLDSSIIGNYNGIYSCCVNDFCDTSPIKFEITPTGSVLSTAQGIVYIIFLIALIFVFSLCLYGAITIKWNHGKDMEGRVISINDLRYVKIFLYVISYPLMMFMVGITRSILANFLFYDNASKVFNWMFWIMFSFMWPIIVLALLITLLNFINSKKLKEALMRGVPLR